MKYEITIESAQVKICINKPKPTKSDGRRRAVIRINEDVYDELATLSNDTGISICELASNMIKFAKDKTTIVEQENATE